MRSTKIWAESHIFHRPPGSMHWESTWPSQSPEHVVVAYHERTKHHYSRYAASLGYLDWANQPNPFRRYEGAPLVHLAFPETGRTPPYWQLYTVGTARSYPRPPIYALGCPALAPAHSSGSKQIEMRSVYP